MKTEIWKTIKGFENYQISNNGIVKNINIKRLKPFISSSGYLTVKLYKNSKGKSYFIHRLIAEYFIPNTYNKKCINHKDGNKLNNSLNNLEWCTHSENTIHAFKTGLQIGSSTGKFGFDNKSSRPVKMIINEKEFKIFGSRLEAERETNISSRKIALCCNGKRKTTGGYKWENYG